MIKDAKMGISRATSLFILYIGQAAMEIANDNKRKTVKESDVLKALEGKFVFSLSIVCHKYYLLSSVKP